MSKKYLPFNSRYLPNFQVVEERHGNVSKFPHTDQLPRLLDALNKEFRDGLPGKIERVKAIGSDYMKLAKCSATTAFCGIINEARKDDLRLFPIFDRDRVARISIVQQITEHHDLGPLHRFKFYAGNDFFQEVYINGRRVCFAGHVLERFSERVPNHLGTDLTNFLFLFFGAPVVVMECNKSPSFVFPYQNSLAAFPVRLSDTEYFLPTCLTADVINDLKLMQIPIAYTHTYDRDYTMPEVRNWNPIAQQLALCKIWQRKEPLNLSKKSDLASRRWPEFGHLIMDYVKSIGHGEGSRMMFLDNLPGLCIHQWKPGEAMKSFSYVEILKKEKPDLDWEQILAQHRAANPDWFSSPKTTG